MPSFIYGSNVLAESLKTDINFGGNYKVQSDTPCRPGLRFVSQSEWQEEKNINSLHFLEEFRSAFLDCRIILLKIWE